MSSILRGADGKLRAPWRIALFFAVTIAVALTLGALLFPAMDRVGAAGDIAINSLVTAGGLLIASALMLLAVDRLPWSYVGLGRDAARPKQWLPATAAGGLAIAVPAGALLAANQLDVVSGTTGSWGSSAVLAALVLLPAALAEELLARGYIFAVLREKIGWRWTLVTTSFGFGALHMGNPGADPQSLLIVVLAGFFLGSILIVTGSLYAVWAAHFAWNWVMAGIFHADVSGSTVVEPAGYRVVDSGPDWLTGGVWGPEGGFAAALTLAIGTAAGLWIIFSRERKGWLNG